MLTRRDRCYLFGRRAVRLTPPQAAEAWYALAEKVVEMGEMDVPKFNDLLIAVRVATVRAITRERERSLITVCDKCLQASCWQGIFMCDEAQMAGIVQKTREELRKLNREHPSYWKTDEELADA